MIHKYSLMLTALTSLFDKRFSVFKQSLFLLFLIASINGRAQVSITGTLPQTYSQNFNALSINASTFTDNSTLLGWYISSSSLTVSTGSANVNSCYNYGTTNDSDRSIGALSTSSNTHQFGLRFKNNATTDIEELDVSFIGEQWRRNQAHTLTFSYRVSSTAITTLTAGTWTNVTDLDFTAPQNGTAMALDGNVAANRTPISGTISVNIPPGSEILLRWTKSGSNSPGLAIDDLSVVAKPSAAPAYIITATSNNESYGTVSLSYTTITATPEECYTYASPAYTVISGTATVVQNGDEFTVAATTDCEVQINFEDAPAYTLSLVNDGVAYTGGIFPYTTTCEGDMVTLPTLDNCGDYTFEGWDTNGSTTSAPAFAGGATYPTTGENVTLYAVYSQTAGGTEEWTRITSLNDIVTGTYVIVNGPFFLPNINTGATTPPQQVTLASKSVTVSGNTLAGTIAADMQWTFTGINSEMAITSTANANDILYNINNNNGVRINTTASNWTFETYNTGFAMRHNNRYCAVYTAGSDWRSYGTRDAANYNTNNGILDIYKKTDGSTTTYTTAPLDCSASQITTGTVATSFCAGDSVTVPFTYSEPEDFPLTTTFTAQLSDAFGSFASATNIGNVASTVSGSQSINATLPTDAAAGTGYRIRVVADTPSTTGANNGVDIVINTTPTITTQVSNQNVAVNTAAVFNIISSNATSYQWYMSTNGGVNWSTLTGETSATYTIPATTLAMNGYQYRVTMFNDCGEETSSMAILSVVDGPCLEENFQDESAIGYTTGNVTLSTGNWYFNYALIQNTSGNLEVQLFSGTGSHILTPTINSGVQNVTFNTYRTSGSGSALQVNYSIDNGTNWVAADESPYNLNQTSTSFTATINTSTPTIIQFRRTQGTVRIDDIEVSCTIISSCDPADITISPLSGPVNTVVTINGSNFTETSTVNFDGVAAASVTYLNATTLQAVVPAGASTGMVTVDTDLDCDSEALFTVITEGLSECEGSVEIPEVSSGQGGLVFYEVFDRETANSGLIVVLNASYSNINLNNYQISRSSDGDGSDEVSDWHVFLPMILAPGQVYVLGTGNTSLCLNYPILDSVTPIDTGLNENDRIRILRKSDFSIVDEVRTPNYMGYYMMRNSGASLLPNLTHDTADWSTTSMSGSNCQSDMGISPIAAGSPQLPSITAINFINECSSATITVDATAGNASHTLTYQWYSNASEQDWTPLTDGAVYSGTTTETLTISDVYDLSGYQYHVRVMEVGTDCYTASDAVQISLPVKTWVGPANGEWYEAANWSPTGVPLATDTVVIMSGSPELVGGGIPIPPTRAFAKTLIIQSEATLLVPSGQNLIVEQCIVNNGTITLENTANLVQTHTGTDLNSGNGSFSMQRIVTGVQNYNYIYWSSPINGVDVAMLPGSGTHRYYWDPTETNANGTEGNWMSATGEMEKGKGYIIRYPDGNVTSTFAGSGIGGATPHNGDFTVTIQKGTLPGIDDNWNLIGNPYPSAISADTFIMENASPIGTEDTNPAVLGTLYLWQHQGTPNTANDPFYEDFQINYNGDNYIAYNVTGTNPPTTQHGFNGYIASGQAFFVLMDQNYAGNDATVTFDNSVRFDMDNTVYENNQFLRQATDTENTMERHRLWLDLISPNNTSVSTLVGYVTGATNDKDRLFDGYETNATGLGFYSLVGNEKMGIQGRSMPFDENDTVPMGVNLLQSGNYTIAINKVDGLFEGGQNIFLEDTYTNTIHNMRTIPYTFYSTGGMFNDRFILRYTNSTLGLSDLTVDGSLTIVELSNGHVKFTVGHNLTIESVEIYDMLGRQLYNLLGTNAVEVYNLANLSQAAYVAKITLSNGQAVTKRAVKRH